jgi:hypothetical protein
MLGISRASGDDKAEGALFRRCQRHGHRREELGSRSEVDVFRARVGARLFVKERVPGEALEFREQLWSRRAIGRAESNIRAGFRPLGSDIEGPDGVRDGDDDQMQLPPGVDLDVGHQQRADAVREGIGQPLLVSQRIVNPDHLFRLVLHADDDVSSRGVGEGDSGAHDAGEGPAVFFELQRLAFVAGEECFDHASPPRERTSSPCRAQLPSSARYLICRCSISG